MSIAYKFNCIWCGIDSRIASGKKCCAPDGDGHHYERTIDNEQGKKTMTTQDKAGMEWCFTFAWDSVHGSHYVRVVDADYNEARRQMVANYGLQWAFQYAAKDFERQITEYGLTEIPLNVTN